MYMKDGSCWFIDNGTSQGINANTATNDTTILRVFVDVNGSKRAPNILGIDLFVFDLKNNGKLAPSGNYDPNNCDKRNSKSKIGSGYACVTRFIQNNYRFDDNYPFTWRGVK